VPELDRLLRVGLVERDDVRERLHRRAGAEVREVGVEVALELVVEDLRPGVRGRHRDQDGLRAEPLDGGDGGLVAGVVAGDDPDPLTRQGLRVERGQVVREHRRWRRDHASRQRARRIERVCAGDRLQLGGGVGDRSGHRPGGVLRGGDRHDPVAAHETDGRAQADDALRRRRADDRAGGLGADVAAASAAAAAVAEPEDEPLGFWSGSSTCSTWPPRPESRSGCCW